MCQAKPVHYSACRHTRVVPVNCMHARLVRKVYRFVDGEEMEFAGVDPCLDWGPEQVDATHLVIVEELADYCNPCKEKRKILPIRIR